MNNLDLSTPGGMLRYLVRRNEYGVWFVQVDSNANAVLPRWLWPWLERAVADPAGVGGAANPSEKPHDSA